ncbi:Histidinol-phosphate aminotransferase [Granulibacter bethesdensis]|nr:Histidinol-phosphate aminotransferase [Granulibacter bethesdensis CGDNIH1]AHJ67128.1 Histidinol-phosphate aminotransferase [Granulibacter bethesdensis]APH50812.1 Histidinol-phosphate aminotransferase [Granulibacter bethesdensis]APH63506.1 Histidinol-phosphate aminotransferase [Granulibacter bethesdensis]
MLCGSCPFLTGRKRSMSNPRPNPGIEAIHPYIGGESKLPGVEQVIKLSSNEGAFGPPPAAQQAYLKAVSSLHRYPDGGSHALREAIGRYFGLDPARIVCGVGSDEMIAHLCMAYSNPDSELIMSVHGFSVYEMYGHYAGAKVVKVPEQALTTDVDALLDAITPRTKVVCIANPNNPTGTMLPTAEIARLRASLPSDVLLVLDAAYAEYVDDPDYDPGVKLVDAGDNTVMTRTFSKIFGLGGLRLGWAYAPPAIVDVLNRVRGPFTVNAAVQEAAIGALEEPGWVERSRAHNSAARAKLATALFDIGIPTLPSVTNFLLADFGSEARAGAADRWLRTRGLIVRRVASYGLPAYLRITIGTNEECDLVAEALRAFMAQAPADSDAAS